MNGILGFADLLKEPDDGRNAARIRLYKKKVVSECSILMI
jgi:hypothetical protein